MSDDDDYLSDKFLAGIGDDVTPPKTYSQLRREALKKSQEKKCWQSNQEQTGAGAQEEEQAGLGSGNKALAMMMKMGFTPGQSLGRQTGAAAEEDSGNTESSIRKSPPPPQHKTEPLPLNEWSGKKGIGTVKRARSPGANDRITKMAKMEEESSSKTFRDRARQDYEQRKADAKLGPAQRTCSTLDEKANKTLHPHQLNVLWLNPNKPETFPSGLMEALALHHGQYIQGSIAGETIQDRLRKQMQADALSVQTERDLDDGEEEGGTEVHTQAETSDKEKQKLVELNQEYDPDFLEEAAQFLRLQPQDRLHFVLSYLRMTYAYCFYCGTEYESQEEMLEQCPGPEEDDHD
ncbi:hypothetical protein NP233_g7269 [Leucocoprinus birnbaumii]|uniref:DUF4187 domain-containing protein n=1 Tax=Leucocoprinus birnbaumii TaxID=56174 RepID=A0AAD5VV03_9AGAR|nr:hypothetical protein NP233_g7269 [Leucocoprinus birnbaumii]